ANSCGRSFLFYTTFLTLSLSLSAKGQKELSLYMENKRAEFKNNFAFPLLVSIASAIIGALITYLFMK
ncbi:hypothetical protein, partial [Limosilactobacillus fermentum]|uniref:hypothetical protein n=1 Tax=Limosilactobacillus fermentum TaxID=1613 RepID=UPI0031E0E51A